MTKRTRQMKQQKERARELRITSTMPEKVLWDDVLDDVEVVAISIACEAGVDVVAWLNGQVLFPSQEQQP